MSVIITFMSNYLIAGDSRRTRSELVPEIKLHCGMFHSLEAPQACLSLVLSAWKVLFWLFDEVECHAAYTSVVLRLEAFKPFFFSLLKGTSIRWTLGHHLGINLSPPVVESRPHHLNTCVLPCAWCFLVSYSMFEVISFIQKFRELPQYHEAI